MEWKGSLSRMLKTTNVFMDMIYRKTSFSFLHMLKYFKHKRELKKFERDIMNGSPSFGLLWKMADFIKSAEAVFFYDNSLKNSEFGLYSSKGYIPGENGFKINSPDCLLIVKLYSDSQRVVLEVDRTKGEGMKSHLAFCNEEWEGEPTIYDEMLLEQLIKLINSKIMMLFEHCYALR